MRRYFTYSPIVTSSQGSAFSLVLPFWLAAMRAKIDITANISQGALIPKIISRLEIDKPVAPERKAKINLGLCFGFSVRFGIYAAEGKLDDWLDALQKTAQWDGTTESLRLSDELSRTAGQVSYGVTRDQATKVASDIPGISQRSFLKSHFFLPQYQLKKHASFAGCFSRDDLAKLLSLPLYELKNSVCLINALNHACAIAKYESDWLYYDPNYSCGPIYLKTVKEVCGLFFLNKPSRVVLNVAFSTWNEDVLRSSVPLYAEFLRSRDLFLPSMLDGGGISTMLQISPEQFERFCELAKTDQNIRTAIASAMATQNSDGWTMLHEISLYARKQLSLSIMLKLAKIDEKFRAAIVSTLPMQNKNNEKAIDFIRKFAPPEIYEKFVALQKQRDVVSTPRLFKKKQVAEGKSSKLLSLTADKRLHPFNR